MKRGELINRGIAAVITLAFMTLVRPDPDPALWENALVSIGMYESLRWCIGFIRKHKHIADPMNEMVDPGDIIRWWNTRINWPMKEVS